MSDSRSRSDITSEVETALIEVELFVKYGAGERAIKRLKTALERSPRSIPLRERLLEVAAHFKQTEEAAPRKKNIPAEEAGESARERLFEMPQLL